MGNEFREAGRASGNPSILGRDAFRATTQGCVLRCYRGELVAI